MGASSIDWAFATVTKQLGDLQMQLTAGALKPNRAQALGAANAVEQYRSGLADRNRFFDGYDPIYTWWPRLPYRKIDAALQAYATLLRDRMATQDLASGITVQALRIDAAPAPKFAEVPDLQDILALPQDEMTPIVRRFLPADGGGRGVPGAAREPSVQYYRDWLGAHKTLDFDRLTRNAQVDYLYLKKRAIVLAERELQPINLLRLTLNQQKLTRDMSIDWKFYGDLPDR